MLADRTLRRQLVTYALLIATCLLLLAISDSKPVRDIRGGINFALTPVRDALTGGARAVGSVFTSIADLERLRREHEAQADLVQQLQEANLEIPVLITQNQKLIDAQRVRRSLGHRTVAAEVTDRDTSDSERMITIGKGTDDGLFVGATVLSAGGSLTGSITDIGRDWARVRLISDPRSLVVGRDVRSGATGEVRGNLSAPLQLRNVTFDESVRVGDLVTTAGIRLDGSARSQFPRDLIIGSVINVDQDPAFVTISALVQPAAALDDLELVLVVTDFRPDPLPGANPTPTPEPTDEPEATPEPTRRSGKTQRP